MRAPTQQQNRRPKKPYHPPRLTVHGDLRRLTLAKGGASGDGGPAKPHTRSTGAPS